MKKFIVFIFLGILFFVQIEANTKEIEENAYTKQEKIKIKKLIDQVKNSSGLNRRVAINKLKIKLRNTNIKIRKKIIKDLYGFLNKPDAMNSQWNVNQQAHMSIPTIKSTVNIPIRNPVKVPVKNPVKVPIRNPVKVPVKNPVKVPIRNPVKVP